MGQIDLPDALVEKLNLYAQQKNISLEQALETWLSETPLSTGAEMPQASDENYYRALFTYAPDAIMVIDDDNRYVDANLAALKALGYSTPELFTMITADIVAPGQEMTFSRVLEQFARSGQMSFQLKLRRHDGTVFDAELDSVRNFVPGRHLGIFRDVSHHKQIQDELQSSFEFLQTIFTASQSSIFIVDVDETGDFHFAGINPAHEAGTGLKIEEIFGKTPEEVPGITPEGAAAVRANYIRCVQSGEAITYEENISFNGNETWWLTQLSPLRDTNGRIYRIIGFSLNITQQKQAEMSQLRIDHLEAELGKEKAIKEFRSQALSMIAHDFKTPLTAVMTSADLVRRYLINVSSEPVNRHLEKIQAQMIRLARMVDNIMFLSSADVQPLTLTLKPLLLEAFLQELLEEVDASFESRIPIQFSLETESRTCLMDEALLRQIVVNLVSNAVKYSRQEGSVQVIAVYHAKVFTLMVKDDGIGIPKEDQAKLFEMFRRGSNVGGRSGTGIGLAIVKQAVEAHGGTIDFISQEHVGTTFTVIIPIQ